MRQVVGSPRTQLRDHHASFKLESGVVVSYSAFCGAVRRLGFSRKRIRKIAYRCDRQRACAWLRELLTFHSPSELGVLDETSKDKSVLQGGWGYSLLEHIMQRVSCLVLYTLGGGFEDWAFTEGTYTKEYFLHVTTENFTDIHGYVRRPMLARPSLPLDARRFAEPLTLRQALSPARRRAISTRERAGVPRSCSTTRRFTTCTSSSLESRCTGRGCWVESRARTVLAE